MQPALLFISSIAFLVGGSITFAIEHAFDLKNAELSFIVGAILGTQVAAFVHHRTAGAQNSFGVKLAVGLSLAVSALVLGMALHSIFRPFSNVEVSVSIAVIGSMIFPFVLFGTIWKALAKNKNA